MNNIMSNFEVGTILKILDVKGKKKSSEIKYYKTNKFSSKGERVFVSEKEVSTFFSVPKSITGKITEIREDGYVVQLGTYNNDTFVGGKGFRTFSEMYLRNCARILK
jgi:hypothetical protein